MPRSTTASRKSKPRPPKTRDLDLIKTVVTGTTSGTDAVLRQQALGYLRRYLEDGPVALTLRTEWDNPWDPDCIQVLADIPELGGEVQIGFVKNANSYCDLCEREYERWPKEGRCVCCGRTDHLRRIGTATRVSTEMRRNPHDTWFCRLDAITGGEHKKPSLGANIEIWREVVAPGIPLATGRSVWALGGDTRPPAPYASDNFPPYLAVDDHDPEWEDTHLPYHSWHPEEGNS